MTNQTLTDSRRKECGDAKPQLSCWNNSFGKGRSFNLDRPLGSHETQENAAPRNLGIGLGSRGWGWGGSRAEFTVQFSCDSPHTFFLPSEICLRALSGRYSLNDQLLSISHDTFFKGQVLPGHYFSHMTETLLGTPKDSLVQFLKAKHLGDNLQRQQAYRHYSNSASVSCELPAFYILCPANA